MIDELIYEWQQTKRDAKESRDQYLELGMATVAFLDDPSEENRARLREIVGPSDWWAPREVTISQSQYTLEEASKC